MNKPKKTGVTDTTKQRKGVTDNTKQEEDISGNLLRLAFRLILTALLIFLVASVAYHLMVAINLS